MTNLFSQIDDATDLSRIREVIARSDRPDALIPLEIARLVISDEAAGLAAQEMSALLDAVGVAPQGARVVALMDATPIRKGDADVKAQVVADLAQTFEVVELVLDDAHVLADDRSLDAATRAVQDADGVVSIGSGTISDIAKVASTRAGGVPHVLVQTAASVDGYTDNVSVVLRAGAKRTIPSRWPDVVLADTEVIADAPRELNTAGFGELLSLFTAPADWWLAARIGTDTTFHPTPRDLLLTFAGDPAQWGAGIGDGDRDAIDRLTRVLAIRGIGTGIAGSTACLSGMEHLISHMLDMYAASHHQEIGLHGAQVGVASIVGASAWDHLFAQLREGRTFSPPAESEDELASIVHEVFAECDPTGALGAECWSDYAAKRGAWAAAADAASAVVSDADALERDLGAMRPDRRQLARALALAGSPLSRSDLGEWVDADTWRWAVANCLYMRNRVTVVDLLAQCGWWTPDDVDAVLALAADAAAEARAGAGA